MWVENISISGFRNIENIVLNVGNSNLLITGENSQGKTSILEALYLVSLFKSFRSAAKEEIVKLGCDSSLIKLKVANSRGVSSCNAVIDRKTGLSVKTETGMLKKSDVCNFINVVIFYPGSLMLIEGGPDKRRMFIDSVIVKCEPSYIKILRRYKRAVLQRNTVLRKHGVSSKADMLDVWEKEIASYGAAIIEKRIKCINDFNGAVSENFSRIFGVKREIKLVYCRFEKSVLNAKDFEEEIIKKLYDSRKKDMRTGYTSAGPHRDEIRIISGDFDMRRFASRGEQRAAVLSLLEAEAELIEEKRGEYPVFLVDDIASEFDEERERNFINSLVTRNMQVIATATTLSKEYIDIFRGKIIKITGGKCTSI